ncbi:hypothetical protein DHEL01_v201373 [Diaporthe helianthi]|uniref:Uncharacterized protein n=1 Tax=Diaporthe helianthi TaxID=158607 RepID=A0A2P5ICQ3_DIAHE|nr:hypothetical protein DHEL01_v201373 [Diaporthe helianthi]
MAGQMTPEDEKGPGEEMQEQAHASSHEQLTLETIPNEIISSIAGMLAVGIHLPYEVSRIFLKTSENGKQQHSNARRDLPGAHKLLSHTSNLKLLGITVDLFLPLIRTCTSQKMKKRHWDEFGAVLCSLWEEVLPRLSRVKKIRMIGNHDTGFSEEDEVLMARELFSA